MSIKRPDDALDSLEQLVPNMTIILWSDVYGSDRYRVHCTPYKRSFDGEWFVQLIHESCVTAHEYSLNEIGITVVNSARWVTTEINGLERAE